MAHARIAIFSCGFFKFETISIGAGLCLQCHDNIEKELIRPIVHKALEKEDCIICHDSHTSNHAALLHQKEENLCYSCHKSSKEAFQKRFIHSSITREDAPDVIFLTARIRNINLRSPNPSFAPYVIPEVSFTDLPHISL